jgi:NAD(P)-dependent dehydrogenase (short-subunit alcohol dehydrogenase family)
MSEGLTYTLITGASSAIGRAIAARLSRSRRLILHGRDLARLEETRQACAEPASHLPWTCDLRNAANVAPALGALVSSRAAGVDGFVHCAGLVHVLPARTATLGAIQDSLSVNYIAAQQIIATLLKKRVNRVPLRSVVLISTIWSRYAARGHSLYCASKAALDGMMRSLALELAPQVRVNSILPGAVPTPMAKSAMSDPEIMSKLQRDYPLGLGRPEDIAAAVEFLMSEDARWITGQEFVVDGGRTVNMSLK